MSTVWAILLAILVVTFAASAHGQDLGLLVVTRRSVESDRTNLSIEDARFIGPAALGRRIEQRFALQSDVSTDPLARARAEVDRAIAAWSQSLERGDTTGRDTSIRALEEVARGAESDPASLATHPGNAGAIQRALVFVAERYQADGRLVQAEDAMRRLARLDPSVALSAQAASPAIRGYYERAVATLPTGALAVETTPPGCDVYRDGQHAGTSPVVLESLAPGAHHVYARCGVVTSRVRRVVVAARTRATVAIDVAWDDAVTSHPPGLRYDVVDLGRVRRDSAVLGRALDLRRVVVVRAPWTHAEVIDVASGVVIGVASITDHEAMRTLADAPPPPPETTHATSNATPHRVVSHVAFRPAPPDARMPFGVATGGIGLLSIATSGVGFLHAGLMTTRATQAPAGAAPQRTADMREAGTWGAVGMATAVMGGALVITGLLVCVLPRSRVPTIVITTEGVAVGGSL